VPIISVLFGDCRGTGRIKTKKAPAASPAGHDYRQPKLEEGTDAFCQVRQKIDGSSAVYSAASSLWPSGYLGSEIPVRVWPLPRPPSSNSPFNAQEFTKSWQNRLSGRRLGSGDRI
jgi:hypothetical protein